MSPTDRDRDILSLNQAMLESVAKGDWISYAAFCDDDLSCFEAETNGVLAEGLPFHRYYFELPADSNSSPVNVSMARPHLRWLSEDAVVLSYTRLTQRLAGGEPMTTSCCETRVWQRQNGTWKQVHVHRS
jgi:calcium/calmodulin-dependent protein kinase (CaM kinase) II